MISAKEKSGSFLALQAILFEKQINNKGKKKKKKKSKSKNTFEENKRKLVSCLECCFGK